MVRVALEVNTARAITFWKSSRDPVRIPAPVATSPKKPKKWLGFMTVLRSIDDFDHKSVDTAVVSRKLPKQG